jgi:indole-3-glycerol phosphate synthase
MVTDVLEEILSRRRAHVAEAKKKIGLGSLQNELKTASPIRPFFDSLVRTGHISVIAEMKKKSPSAGLLKNDYDVTVIARNYEKGGAKALSVLTEPDRFGGSVSDLSKARAAVGLPVLEKDFIFDPYQIIEARVWGADAVLLIADMMKVELRIFLGEIRV